MEAHLAGAGLTVKGCRVCSSKIALSPSSVLAIAVILLLCPHWVISKAAAQATGYQFHAPVLGAAGRINPWGALADIVKQAVAAYGWDVQVCYNCAGGEQEVIDVENKSNAASLPYNPTSYESDGVPASLITYIQPPPPNGPIDFGIAAPQFIWWGYQGTQTKAGLSASAPPYTDLRLVATIVAPVYLIIAATVQSGITDLSQIAGKPVTVLWDNGITSTAASEVLAYYGLSQASIQAVGGSVLSGSNPANRTNFDVIIYTGDLSEAPEFNIWYQLSQQADLNYIQLPTALLQQLQDNLDMIPLTVPTGF